MISFVRGTLVSTGPDYVVVDVAGVGYKVFVPTPAVTALAGQKDGVTVYTYLHVRDDAMQLFGFVQESDRQIFEQLIQVSGIGPRVALAVLSSMPSQALVQAVLHEQTNVLTRIPGVGKKMAQRIIIELKDKLGKLDISEGHEPIPGTAGLPDASGEALEALIALGYNPGEAKRVLVSMSQKEIPSLKPQELVRLALKELGKF